MIPEVMYQSIGYDELRSEFLGTEAMYFESSPATEATPLRHRRRWLMAHWFPWLGILVGGGGVVLWGMYMGLVFAPPPPPGTVYCGTCALAGWFVILFLAPVAAFVSSIFGWIVGLFVDDIRAERELARRQAAAALTQITQLQDTQ
jgi:hypothetical protein